MDKQQLLNTITEYSEKGLIGKQELLNAYKAGISTSPTPEKSTQELLANVLYFIGVTIIFLGIAAFIAQKWSSLNFFTQVLTTFGTGIAAYIIGVVLLSDGRFSAIGHAFFLLSALLLPAGLFVIFDHYGWSANYLQTQCIISAILLISFIISYYIFHKFVFVLFNFIYGTWLFLAIIAYITQSHTFVFAGHLDEYIGLTLGLSYIIFGMHFAKSKWLSFSGVLYTVGSFFFLGAAFSLGGWTPTQSAFWELLFPLFVFGIIYSSVYLQSKALLTFGTLFLMAYVCKLTTEYFAKTIGWPIALVLSGLFIIVIAYIAITMHRRYFRKKEHD